jgi:NitT/TauT family transport system permease protein
MARRVGLVVVGYLGLGAIWAFLSAYYFNAVTLPPPSAVLSYMWDLAVSGAAFTNFASSIGKIVAGFAIGTLIGAPIGLLMGRSQYWKNFWLRPILTIGNIPGLCYAVFALIFFGLGAKGPILAVTLVALPFVALNVMEGVEGVDERLVHMSKVYGRRSMDITRSVFIPTVAPFLFAALRYGFAMAWKVEALTEVFGGKSGIGFMIRAEYNAFSVVGVLAWTGFFVIFMLIIERLVLARLEHWVFAWRGVA